MRLLYDSETIPTLLLPTYIVLVSDNEKPTVTSSEPFPQVDVTNVELTCENATNDVVGGYQWFKNNVRINTATAEKYQLPGKAKSDSGFKYQCKVVATYVPPSTLSDELTVTFLCKLIIIFLNKADFQLD